jgi:hypothetical protein
MPRPTHFAGAILRVALLAGLTATAAQAQPAPGVPPQPQAPGLAPPDGLGAPRPHPPGPENPGPDARGPDNGLDGHGPHNPGSHGPDGGALLPGPGPLAGLARAEADTAAATAIAGLAHVPQEDAQRILRAFGVPTALRYYDIDPPAFRAAVTPLLLALVDGALHDHAITDRDAARLSAQLRQGPGERPGERPHEAPPGGPFGGPPGPKEPPQPE